MKILPLLLCATLPLVAGNLTAAQNSCETLPNGAKNSPECAIHVLYNPPIIAAGTLDGISLLEIRATDERDHITPGRHYTRAEIALVTEYVQHGGALLVVIDEQVRTPLYADGVEALIEPFGLRYTPDLEYLHNCGAIAKKGAINAQDREIPYSGGRSVTGGTPFAWRLDAKGKPAEPMAAYAETENGGRIVALSEAMAYIGMGEAKGVRLSGVPHNVAKTIYWGKDSALFMQEVRNWLANASATKRHIPSQP